MHLYHFHLPTSSISLPLAPVSRPAPAPPAECARRGAVSGRSHLIPRLAVPDAERCARSSSQAPPLRSLSRGGGGGGGEGTGGRGEEEEEARGSEAKASQGRLGERDGRLLDVELLRKKKNGVRMLIRKKKTRLRVVLSSSSLPSAIVSKIIDVTTYGSMLEDGRRS